MNIFRWWKKRRSEKKVASQSSSKDDKDICPECSGHGYNLNYNHYLADSNDYERRYLICWRCHGTGHYTDIDKY